MARTLDRGELKGLRIGVATVVIVNTGNDKIAAVADGENLPVRGTLGGNTYTYVQKVQLDRRIR